MVRPKAPNIPDRLIPSTIPDGDLPCYRLKMLLSNGELMDQAGRLIRTQAQLARITGIDETKMSEALRLRKYMTANVAHKGGKPRWMLICEAVNRTPGDLFPELPFDIPGGHYSLFINPGETREIVPAPKTSQIELQPRGGVVIIKLDGEAPRSPLIDGYSISNQTIVALRHVNKSIFLSAIDAKKDAQAVVYVSYRWLP